MILRIQTDSADWKLEVQVLNSWRWKNFCNICNMLLHNEPELLHFENLKKQLWPHQNIDLESKWGYPRGWFHTYCTVTAPLSMMGSNQNWFWSRLKYSISWNYGWTYRSRNYKNVTKVKECRFGILLYLTVFIPVPNWVKVT